MSHLDHERVTNIFADAMELPVSRRGAFLDSTCGGEPDLRRELDELLGCAGGASVAFDAASQQIVHPDPDRIGPYELLEPVGEGGMAVVYRAQQHHPVKRVVAVKLIKLGMDTRQFVARFEAERQALAMMDHPNVARVFDAGSTGSGRPYFVMEYVPGEPILDWCDARDLALRDRLALFIPACEAVEHAHRKGIIHRDLKSSNVLVSELDGRALPKVIDFGVAKVVSRTLTDGPTFTEQGQLIGTPEYMSPEQAERGALDVDTRSDVYSLGVLLYQLIAGVQPIPSDVWRGGSFEHVQRIVRENEVPRPSMRLGALAGDEAAGVARRRGTTAGTLLRELRNELEWIPLKAMRRDREQRYRSAAELADDVRNYLDGRPLIAGPESTRYRLGKFLRRHKPGVVAAAIMALLLIAGIVTTTWQAVRANREKREAQFQRHEAVVASENLREVNRFLTEDLLHSAAPEVTRGKDLTVREAVDRAAETVSQRFRERPLSEAAVRAVLADTYSSLGQTEAGLQHAQVGWEIHKRESGPDGEQTLLAALQVGRALATLNRHGEAEPMLRDACERSERLLGRDHPVTIECVGGLAMTLRMQRRFAEAEPLYRRLLETNRRLHGPQSDEAARALNSLAVLMNTQGRADEAEPLYRQSLEIRVAVLGRDHPSYLTGLSNFARVLERQGRWSEAEALHREVLQAKRRVLKDDHPSTMLSMNNLAAVLAQLQKYEEAETLHREALARRRRVLGEDDIETIQSIHNLGRTLALRGNYADAEHFHRQALEKRERVLGENHLETLTAAAGLAWVFEQQNRWADARPLLSRVCDADRLLAFSQASQAQITARLGRCLAELNQFAQAEPVLLDARRRLTETRQSDGRTMGVVLAALAEVCDQTNRPGEASSWRAELNKLQAATRPASVGR